MNNLNNTQETILSDENMQKVCLIHEIVNAGKALGLKQPDADDFDRMYDCDIPTLVEALDYAQHTLKVRHSLKALAKLMEEINQNSRPRNPEDDAC